MALFLLTFSAKDEAAEQISALLASRIQAGWQEESLAQGETLYLVYHQDRQVLADLQASLAESLLGQDLKLQEDKEEDWLCTWKEHFQPVLCGEHFVVLPPWSIEAWAKENQDSQRLPIIIEPKNAFGTGQHASTALCLSFLSDEAVHLREKMRQSKLNFLDLGTGSGILAIAASKLGLSGQALDIDPDAVANAKENFKANGLNSTVQVALGSIDKVAGQHFQLIFANILAAPLIAMASPLAQALEKQGRLILSGLLNEQNDQVSAAFVACGLKKIEERSQGEWCALLFEA